MLTLNLGPYASLSTKINKDVCQPYPAKLASWYLGLMICKYSHKQRPPGGGPVCKNFYHTLTAKLLTALENQAENSRLESVRVCDMVAPRFMGLR